MLRKNNKGFSLIELIVVIAIIGILVMLAAPRFIGFVEKAEVARIQNDVKVMEGKIAEEYIDSGYDFDGDIDGSVIDDMIGEKTVYSIEGKVDKGTIANVKHKIVEAPIVKDSRTKLDGTFYADAEGNVYYVEDTANIADGGSEPEDGANLDANNCPTTGYVPVAIGDEVKGSAPNMPMGPEEEANLFVFFEAMEENFGDTIEQTVYEKNDILYILIQIKSNGMEGETTQNFFSKLEDSKEFFIFSPDGEINLEPDEYWRAAIMGDNVHGEGDLTPPEYVANYSEDEMSINTCNEFNVNIGNNDNGDNGNPSCPIGEYVFEDFFFVDIIEENLFELDNGNYLEANLEIDEDGTTSINYQILNSIEEDEEVDTVKELTIDNKGVVATRYGKVKLEDGKVYTKGPNISGVLGIGESNTTFLQENYGEAILENVKDIGVADTGETGGGVYALMENGDVYVWGTNWQEGSIYGVIGLGNETMYVTEPTKLDIGTEKVKQIETYHGGSIVLTETGKIYSTGNNEKNYLGLDENLYPSFVGELTEVTGLSNIEELKMLPFGVESKYFAKSSNGDAYIWGDNIDVPEMKENKIFEMYKNSENGYYYYENNNEVYRLTREIADAYLFSLGNEGSIVKIFSRDFRFFILLDDGTIWGQGPNYGGQLLDGTDEQALDPIKVGEIRGCYIEPFEGPGPN